jgi:hypothetical protein
MTSQSEREESFDDVLAVVDYLTKSGWRIKKSTAYNHRDKGWLRPGADGKYTLAAVDKYAALKLKRLDGSKKDKIEKMNADRQAAETRRLNALAEREEMKLKILKGNYVDKGSFERELAHRAQLLKTDGESFCRSQAAAIISLVVGDRDKIPDLTEYMLEAFAGWLNRYAADREFTVPPPAAEDILLDPEDEGDDGTGE